jgi:hypothetical protein
LAAGRGKLESAPRLKHAHGLAAHSKAAWGASLRFVADFSGRLSLVSSSRQLIAQLCAAYLEPTDQTAALVMAAQELLENLAKYSIDGDAAFEFVLFMKDDQAHAKISSVNAASDEHLAQAAQLLERIASSTEPVALYDDWVARSGDREGSRLGLIRLRAEAELSLTHSVESGRLHIEAVARVDAKRNTP